ncbi:TetR/AcrR family transcriptional regulator C-terminal domain-containing protein [Pseudomonas sp. 7P_10.2_Bac1]|uniref:TetR/AcrR family transcriptional regulator C-terminal domain-containing protein n=1 Tax=Pseudomonas sp. 7P_10.2_Bac1 TaxID=2971614 RepID=UPI00290577C1|nr:TetR/AcrR family transcriptional regulator C-terminal domain-containing protein [Pseudomonas sp. 7P_10.2_Bac1]
MASVKIVPCYAVGCICECQVAESLSVNSRLPFTCAFLACGAFRNTLDALLDAIAGHVLSRLVVPAPSGNLRADIIAIAQAFRAAAMSSHREAALLVLSRPIESSAHVMPLEATLAVLMSAAAEPEWAVHALRATLAFISGSLIREASTGLTLGAGDSAIVGQREAALVKLGLPNIALVANHLSHLDHDREFDFGIGVLADAFVDKLLTQAKNA